MTKQCRHPVYNRRSGGGTGGGQMSGALKLCKIPTGLSVSLTNRTSFPARASRGIESSGCCFDHWLMGARKPEYEVAPEEELPVKPRQATKPAK